MLSTFTRPQTFEALYRDYFRDALMLVGSKIGPSDAEDVAHTIMLKFFERDILKDYDENYGQGRNLSPESHFRAFFLGAVSVYLRHYVDRQRVEARRRASLSLQEGSTDPDLALGALDPYVETYEGLATRELVHRIRERLSTTEERSGTRVGAEDLFRFVISRALTEDKVSLKEISEHFGVSSSGAWKAVQRLRAALEGVL